MKKVNKIITLVLFITLLAGCGKTIPTLKDGTQAVATIDGESISTEELYQVLKTQYGKDQLINLIDKKILEKKYETSEDETSYVKEKVEEMEKYASQYSTTVDSLLQAYYGISLEQFKEQTALNYKRELAVKDALKETITDKEIEEYYDKNIFGQINCKHILIAPETLDGMTEEEKEEAEKKALEKAKSIIKKLDKGEDFDKLAKKYSTDSSTKNDGGKLGWFKYDDMLEEFSEAAFALKKGKYTTSPIKTKYGYHIIYKIDEEKKPTLKDSKDEIISELVTNKLSSDSTLYYKTLEDIRKNANLEIVDTELKKAYDNYMSELKTKTN